MSHIVFFSWQSDTPRKGGRDFIEQALNRAVGAINSNLDIQDADRPDPRALVIDKDTKGVPGSPSIVDTILGKIDTAFCFAADLTFVAERSNGGGVPNPNVMVEYGYALRSLGEKQVVSVMNDAYGSPTRENMPFDLAHKRFPITYSLPADATQDARKQQLAELAKILEGAIRDIFDHMAGKPKTSPPVFPMKMPILGNARFRPPLSDVNKKTVIGRTASSPFASSAPVVLDEGPAMYLRVFPTRPQNREWTLTELKNKESGPRGLILLPFQEPSSRFNAEDGCGWYSIKVGENDTGESDSVVIAFATGEIWAVDTSWLRWWTGKIWLNSVVSMFKKKLEDYSYFLQGLGIDPPFSWIAGFEDIEGLILDYEAARGYRRFPGYEFPCLAKSLEQSGNYSPGDNTDEVLRPFFESLCDKCAMEPPRHIIPAANQSPRPVS
jgi:hypothetical protein